MNWLKRKFEQFRAWLTGPLPSVEMYKAMELKQRERHEELMGAIQGLTQTLQQAHVTRPTVQAFEYTDWDSAQLAAMIEMQRNPEKEH